MEQECRADDTALLKDMFHRIDNSGLEPVSLITSDDTLTTAEHAESETLQQGTESQAKTQDDHFDNEEFSCQIFAHCYKCGMCGADFTSYEELKDHLYQHHFANGRTLSETKENRLYKKSLQHVILFTGTESFRCEICNIHFAQSDLAYKHMECHKQYQCQACKSYFNDLVSLHIHKTVCMKNAFTCSICGKGYAKQSNLIRHKKTHVFKKCSYCDAMFLNNSDLEEHLSTHEEYKTMKGSGEKSCKEDIVSSGSEEMMENKDQISVPQDSGGAEPLFGEDTVTTYSVEILQLSDDDFSDLMSFDDQVRNGETHGTDDNMKYKCKYCDKLFKGNRELKSHVRIHFKVYKCDLCEKSFKTLEELEDHEDVHDQDDPLKCNVCDRKFRLNRHLKQHMKIHVKEFRCEECGQVFQAFMELREHRRIHTSTAPFKCEICNQRFTLKKCLQKHYSIHTGEKPHQCKNCNKCFRLVSSLRHHERVHSGELPFKCDTCDKRFRLCQALKKHIASNHSAQKPYTCDICGKGFVEKGRLTAHRSRIHFGKNKNMKRSKQSSQTQTFPCLLCQEGFAEKSTLDEHLVSHHSKQTDGEISKGEQEEKAEESKLFVCVKCGKGFSTCEKLLAHMRRHGEPAWLNTSGACRSTCHICNKTVNYLQKHLITHTGVKPFKCDVCGKGFPERYILTKHMKTHSTVRQYECKLCSSAFKRGDNLKRHLRITHNVNPEKYNINDITSTKNKSYSCKKCDIVFTEEAEFQLHKKSHSEKVPAVCSMCGKLFTNTVHLKSHMKIHANWRPYMCETCGKTFTENSQLKKHIRIHTGEKPYACQLCDKSFSQSCSLNNHMKSHQFAGETPFKCHMCPAAFAFCGELEKHKKGHMGTDVFGCGMCNQRFSHPDDLKSHVDDHMVKTTTTTETPIQQQDVASSQYVVSSEHLHTSITSANISYPAEDCVQYSAVTVPYSTPVEPVVTLSYHQTTVDHSPLGSYPQGPGPADDSMSYHETTVPQTINMYHVQTLVHEAQMLIQNTHQNQ